RGALRGRDRHLVRPAQVPRRRRVGARRCRHAGDGRRPGHGRLSAQDGSRTFRSALMSRAIDQTDATDLARRFGNRLLTVGSPLRPALADGASADCAAALANLRTPSFIPGDPGAYHTTGWLGAYEPHHSAHAVAVETAADIAAVVGFARDRGLRVAIRGTGHGYLGRPRAAGSLRGGARGVAVGTLAVGLHTDAR